MDRDDTSESLTSPAPRAAHSSGPASGRNEVVCDGATSPAMLLRAAADELVLSLLALLPMQLALADLMCLVLLCYSNVVNMSQHFAALWRCSCHARSW